MENEDEIEYDEPPVEGKPWWRILVKLTPTSKWGKWKRVYFIYENALNESRRLRALGIRTFITHGEKWIINREWRKEPLSERKKWSDKTRGNRSPITEEEMEDEINKR